MVTGPTGGAARTLLPNALCDQHRGGRVPKGRDLYIYMSWHAALVVSHVRFDIARIVSD